MKISRALAATVLLSFIMLFSVDVNAQTVSVKVGTGDKEKKDEPKEKVVEKVVEKSGPSVEQELKKLFGLKSETSLTGPRVENIGKYFLDKYTGEVTVVGYYKNEPVRWRILRDNVPEDVIDEERAIQFLRYHMWDIEKSIMEQPGYWRYLVIEHHGSLPCDDESIARKIYNFAVKVKLDRLSEIGINLNEIYRRFNK